MDNWYHTYYDTAIDINVEERVEKEIKWKYRNDDYVQKLIKEKRYLDVYSEFESISDEESKHKYPAWDKHDLLKAIDDNIKYRTLKELKQKLQTQILRKRQLKSELYEALYHGQYGDIISIVYPHCLRDLVFDGIKGEHGDGIFRHYMIGYDYNQDLKNGGNIEKLQLRLIPITKINDEGYNIYNNGSIVYYNVFPWETSIFSLDYFGEPHEIEDINYMIRNIDCDVITKNWKGVMYDKIEEVRDRTVEIIQKEIEQKDKWTKDMFERWRKSGLSGTQGVNSCEWLQNERMNDDEYVELLMKKDRNFYMNDYVLQYKQYDIKWNYYDDFKWIKKADSKSYEEYKDLYQRMRKLRDDRLNDLYPLPIDIWQQLISFLF